MRSINRRDLLRHGALFGAASIIPGFWAGSRAGAQDAGEQLGAGNGSSQKGPHPLLEIEAKYPAALKPELSGIHPRVFFTESELNDLRAKSRTTHAKLWQRALSTMICVREEPAPPPAQDRRAQNDVALAIGEAAFAYKIERDPKFLALALKFMDAAVSYDVWGYISSKPNIDLAAGHLLYGLAWGYDLLYHDLSESQRKAYREKLQKHGRLLFETYSLKPGRVFTYSQNHLFIPAAGLGIAAYALYGEVPEAADWARRVRALFDRTLATYSPDGYYYEGFEYWVFSTPWIVHYLDALLHCTGEDLYDQPGLRKAHVYVAHCVLPDGKNVADFGDVFSGPLTRAGKSPEYDRTHPGGHLHSNYHLLYRLAQRFGSGEAQGVANWLESLQQNNFEDYWALAWYDPSMVPVPIERQPTSQHFTDHDVYFWRTGWTANATAFAFKCGPPEGHHTTELIARFPDWRREEGHAHPDAGAFILFAGGKYLTGVTGYAGIPMTNQVNSLLIDGRGQALEGKGHNAFMNVPYDRLNRILIRSVDVDAGGVTVVGDATAAYEPGIGLESFVRTGRIEKNQLTISDSVEADTSHVFSVLLHWDGDRPPGRLEVQINQPVDASQKLEPNVLIGPGAPGSVDKGTQEQRGTRLVISTPAPVASASFQTILRF
jgi:hypothetical protein